MNNGLVVPELIASVIDQKRQAMRSKQEADERQKLEKRNANIAAGREKLQTIIAATLLEIPEWLRPYDVTEKTFEEDDLERIGNDSQINQLKLQFFVPGLAPIQFRMEKVRGTEECTKQWRSAQFYSQWREYGPHVPRLDFNANSHWRADLEFTLVEAKDEFNAFEEATEEFIKQQKAETLRAEQQLKQEEAADARRALEQKEKEAEELQLFNLFKNDPLAIQLLKTFVLVRDERSYFEQMLFEADETMSSMEARWSRRAEELRRQADEAQRRAEDERSRLQDDLDDAEAKLKKVQRGW